MNNLNKLINKTVKTAYNVGTAIKVSRYLAQPVIRLGGYQIKKSLGGGLLRATAITLTKIGVKGSIATAIPIAGQIIFAAWTAYDLGKTIYEYVKKKRWND